MAYEIRIRQVCLLGKLHCASLHIRKKMKHVTFSSLNSWTWLLSQQCMHPIGKWRIWQYQGFCQAVCMYCLLKSIMDYTTSCEFFNCRNKIVTLLTEQNQSLGIPPFLTVSTCSFTHCQMTMHCRRFRHILLCLCAKRE